MKYFISSSFYHRYHLFEGVIIFTKKVSNDNCCTTANASVAMNEYIGPFSDGINKIIGLVEVPGKVISLMIICRNI